MSLELMMKKQNDLNDAFAQFKEANDARLKQLEAKGSVDPLLTAKVETTNTAIEELKGSITSIQTAMARSNATHSLEDTGASKEAKAAFRKFLAKGERHMSEQEIKYMSVGTDADGGYLVLPEFGELVDVALREISPMRQLAGVMQIGSDELNIPVKTAGVASGWVAETGARTATAAATLGNVQIKPEELYANPEATQKFLDDASVDVEAWLQGEVAEEFAETEGTAFISGNGTNKPKGILGYAAGTAYNQVEQILSGSAGSFDADDLIELLYGLKTTYSKNATFLMARATEKFIRKLKDSNNQYIWQPGLQAGAPSTILGRPTYTDENMPAIAADALAIACGDLKRAYKIVDRVGVRILRDPFSNKPYVGFYTTKRVGGGVVVSEAIKLLKLAAP